ncbi:MAG: hypothetical protein ACUVXI_17980 [bacterium]
MAKILGEMKADLKIDSRFRRRSSEGTSRFGGMKEFNLLAAQL